jgi:Tat protein secretion system quality control protein TatD with DNase activity
VRHVAEAVASLLDLDVADLASLTTQNACRFYDV